MGQNSYLIEVGVEVLHRGLILQEGHQVPVRLQGLLVQLKGGRLLLNIWGWDLLSNGTLARIAHVLKIMTHLRKRGK